MKPTNAYKVSVELIYIVCLPHISASLMTILREVIYKGYIIKKKLLFNAKIKCMVPVPRFKKFL
jgi:hypothetical protein